MIPIRHAPQATENEELKERMPLEGETNRQWLARAGAKDGLLLLGGNALAHFRIRVAQSHLRQDLLPSFWSFAGILDGSVIHSAPLDGLGDASLVPVNNGVQECPLSDYDDPGRFPNIAILYFAKDAAAIRGYVDEVRSQRALVDLPSLMLKWLGFVWGAGQPSNPLLEGHGLPSAALVETVYGIGRIDLTPGLSSSSSCPEAIWQAAKWWRRYYEETATPETQHEAAVPAGYYAIRQPAAFVVEYNAG